MSLAKIRTVLEKKLVSMTPALATAYENVHFSPANATPYQRTNLLPAMPDDLALTADVVVLMGIFQVTLCYPAGTGPAPAQARAQMVVDAFKPVQILSESGVKVWLTQTPQIAAAMVDADRWLVPISIHWRALI